MAILPEYRITAPAKINLFLDVIGVLQSGYHEIDTVMQSVTLCDDITIESGHDRLEVRCSESWLDGEDNLAYKAAKLFSETTGINVNHKIYIEKRIPIGGGLAGGSTDAAAVLYALNVMHSRPLNADGLYSIAQRLGADVSFCVYGGSMHARGIGERLTPCPCLPDCSLLMVISDTHVSAGEAYSKLDAEGFTPRKNTVLDALAEKNIEKIGCRLFNIFERIAPETEPIKAVLYENGALGALMSGSGPTVFGIFNDESKLKKAADAVKAFGLRYAVCHPCGPRDIQ